MTDQLGFEGRVAVLTGAGRGVGRAYALALAERGARVVVNDLGCSLVGEGSDPGPASAVAAEIVAAGGEAVANHADVTAEDGAASIVEQALERFGRLDVVVNNAGNMGPEPIEQLGAKGLRSHLDVHAVGALNVTRAAWPHLVEARYGRVVVTTSIGLFGGPFIAAYSAAKGAAFSLGRSLALAGAEHGVLVNLLAPVAETRMVTDPELRARVNLPPLAPGFAPDPVRGAESVVPMLLVLAHESCPSNGETYVAGLGRFARIFTAETTGLIDPGIQPEQLLGRWDEVVDESGYTVEMATADSVAFRERLVAEAGGDG
ncbi:MAG: SDR family NAD(P)-dependent oxidoreductase [Solirubrobacterales bacterium]